MKVNFLFRSEVMRILLVEDNPGDAHLVEFLLRQTHEHRVKLSQVSRLSAAIELLQTQEFDVLLLDLGLPDSDGIEAVSRVYAAFPLLPIVVFTGNEDEALGTEAVRRGAQDYLVKGEVDGWSLMKAINFAAERKRAESQLGREQHLG